MNEIDDSFLYEEYKLDEKYFPAAEEDIRGLFEREKKEVFYTRQLQIKFEKKYFPWVTYRVLEYLHDLGFLHKIERPQKDGRSITFYIHYSNRYAKRKIKTYEKIISEFSQDHITRSCGQCAENLFCLGLVKRGFGVAGEKVREFKGKKWTESGHDLDFVFERDGIFYGCEIKNTLGYIERQELDIKIKMSKFFGIRPFFILRYAPKHYLEEIRKNGGIFLLFETQIYDLSQKGLVDTIQKKLGLPVICSRAIPDGILKRFENLHKVIKSKKMRIQKKFAKNRLQVE